MKSLYLSQNQTGYGLGLWSGQPVWSVVMVMGV
jgi:hypothetical protein